MIEAHDINDNGWIVGWGSKDSAITAYLLIPLDECPEALPCEGDLDGDGTVDGKDLGSLLDNWSIPTGSLGCHGEANCPSDFNCDGVVDGIDLGILLANWGSCSSFGPSQGPPSLEQLVAELIELGFEDEAVLLLQVYSHSQ